MSVAGEANASSRSRGDWLSIRPYRTDDEGPVLQLLKETLGETASTRRTPGFWRWKHFDNPFGQSIIRVACNAADEVIGVRAFMRWQLRMGDQQVEAVEAVDTATHAGYRRLGVFSDLTRKAVDDARAHGIRLIFNTPNRYARPGYLRIGWQDVGMVKPFLLVIRPVRFATRLAEGSLGIGSRAPQEHVTDGALASADRLAEPRESVAELLANSQRLDRRTVVIRKNWSVKYLHWRYAKHPNVAYSVVRPGGVSGSRCLGIVRTNTRLGLREALLSEVILTGPDVRPCRELLTQLKTSLDVDYILASAQSGSFLDHALRRCGFRSIPTRAMELAFESRLSRFPEFQKPRRLAVRRLDTNLPVDPLRLENWALSIGDLEF